MAKPTLYEILGVAENASDLEIQRAFEGRRKLLCDAFEAEDRRNRLSFLDHAREVLLDPRRRAAYDKRSQDNPADGQPPRTRRQKRRYSLVAIVMIMAGLWLGRQFLPGAGTQAPSTRNPMVAAESPATPVIVEPLPSVEEAAAAFAPSNGVPDPGAAPPSPEPIAAPPAVSRPGPGIVAAAGQRSPLMDKILESTYAIVGGEGLGTGVAIEAERLLTNCHVIAPNVLKGKLYAISPLGGASFEITEAAFLVREDACVVHAPGLSARPMALGDSSRLQRGARLYNIGFGDGRLTLGEGQYLGSMTRFGQSYMVSTNFCIPGVSGGPLVDDDGRLVGLTSGGGRDSKGNNVCASLTVETARAVLAQRMMQIDAFPPNYVTNWTGRR